MLPGVNCGAAEKASVLNHRCTVRWLFGSIGSPVTIGRSVPPVFVREAALTTVKAMPDCQKAEALTCQLARNPCASPVSDLPHGSS